MGTQYNSSEMGYRMNEKRYSGKLYLFFLKFK